MRRNSISRTKTDPCDEIRPAPLLKTIGAAGEFSRLPVTPFTAAGFRPGLLTHLAESIRPQAGSGRNRTLITRTAKDI